MKQIRRILVIVGGGTVLAIGVAMMVLPGPAFLVIPLGLGILAIEFAWARRWLRSAKTLLVSRPGGGAATRRKKLSLQSVRRSAEFLLRQVRRTLTGKKNTASHRI
jgi:hypothetical protein